MHWNAASLGIGFQTGFQVYLGYWSRDHRRWRRAMTMQQDCAKWDKLFLSATIQMQSLSYISRSDKHIFWQVCESARINFDSFRKAVKAACKCKTKECPAWDCWCDDEDEDEETVGSCRCPTCDCDVCSSCKVINNMLTIICLSSNVLSLDHFIGCVGMILPTHSQPRLHYCLTDGAAVDRVVFLL